MKIEKLRNNHKKEIIIGTILLVVIGGALTFRLTHSKYRVTQSIDLGSGVINYKVPDFKIMAMYQQKDESSCTDDSCYTELTGRMPSSGYVINDRKSYCNLNGSKDTEAKLYTNSYGEHVVSNFQKSEKCYLYFDKYVPTASEKILANLGTNIKTTTPDFSKTAATDEGVYSTSDGMYGNTTYYWRGAVENNYVKFAGFCWRIVRINGDGTIRMIYDGSTCHANGIKTTENLAQSTSGITTYQYNASHNQSNYVGWTYSDSNQRTTGGTASNAKSQTESWYNSNIGNNATYSAKVADGKYCNDRNAQSGNTWAINGNKFFYAAYKRIYTDYSPTFNCPSGDVYTLKVGLITADEVMFAGGKDENNSSYYLYNGQAYWTMSPSNWNSTYTVVLYMNSNGDLGSYYGVHSPLGLRPVINLKSDVTFSSGNGTQNQPYVIS